jgi:lysophospholipase L1-like esterase
MLALVLALALGAQPGCVDRRDSRDARDRRACGVSRCPSGVDCFLKGGPAASQIAAGTAVSDTLGNSVSYTRSAANCTNAAGGNVALGANVTCVETGGIKVGTGITAALANPLTAQCTAGRCCYFFTHYRNTHWTWTGFPVIASLGTHTAANSWSLLINSNGKLQLRMFDSAGTEKAIETTDTAAFTGPRNFGVCLNTASGPSLWFEGALASTTYVTGSAGAFTFGTPSPNNIYFGRTQAAGNPADGNTRDFKATTGGAGSATAPSRPQTGIVARIAAIGDSTTSGIGIATPWPARVEAVKGATYQVDNYGVPSTTLSQMLTRYRTYVKGKGYTRLILLGGTNDLYPASTAAVVWPLMQTIADEALADGLAVTLVTILPRKNSSGWSAGVQTEHESVNASALSWCTTHSQACVDGYDVLNDGTDAALLLAANDSGDHLHPNQTGHTALGNAIAAAIP